IGQQWAVVLVVHYADSSNSGEGARREAGPLLGRLVKALTGWAPAIDVAPLARSARQSPPTYASGYFYFPLVFTARFVYPRVKSWKP
ncbi:hypothetical protein I5J65_32130, partial [Pseudomonas aeruginosa]|nr:hypothetical protein [Pseudomonas aeruginosa]MBH8711600.1 hypothetical protein [Pseudomonas aeruginosa]